jgi:carboxypeptidase family protein
MTARLSVEESFRGPAAAEQVFEMNDCPYPFKLGERYLVYAHKNREGKLYQRIGFSRTRPLSEAGEDLEFIRGLATAQPGSRVYGKVTRPTHNIKESRYDDEPLTGVKVILEMNDQHFDALTNGEGQYQFNGLTAGSYRVRAELPEHLSFAGQTIKLTGQGCLPLNISALREGQIAGRVLDADGQPVIYVPVSLVWADAGLEEILSEKRGAWTFSVTNEQGRFEFAQLAPGRYLLIINRAEFEKSRGSEKAQSIPRLFYPGVADLPQATVINVREGQKPRQYDFRLLTR